ncbi:hypothetical protein PVAP13_7NG105378 [Panicum virgatum]|uniref:Uncharacterized protein n=1 Tax=Panicum virgatum TaxID=38727 RepID=A0A8T0Q1S4_PANVG|nr:hypothetical protein PVAP13_7NG105378 [Panicum virgatum]
MEAGCSVHDRRRRRCQAAPGASWTGGGRPRRARQTGGWRPADGADRRRATGADGADGADGSRADGADGLHVTGTVRTATNRRRDELQQAAAADGRDGRWTSGRCGWPRRATAAKGRDWQRTGRKGRRGRAAIGRRGGDPRGRRRRDQRPRRAGMAASGRTAAEKVDLGCDTMLPELR